VRPQQFERRFSNVLRGCDVRLSWLCTHSIDVPHFYQLRYREGDHVMLIETDLREQIPWLSKKQLCAWEPPHEVEPISDEKREEILARAEQFLTEVKGYSRVDIVRE
jgi:hypothetical protein